MNKTPLYASHAVLGLDWWICSRGTWNAGGGGVWCRMQGMYGNFVVRRTRTSIDTNRLLTLDNQYFHLFFFCFYTSTSFLCCSHRFNQPATYDTFIDRGGLVLVVMRGDSFTVSATLFMVDCAMASGLPLCDRQWVWLVSGGDRLTVLTSSVLRATFAWCFSVWWSCAVPGLGWYSLMWAYDRGRSCGRAS